MCLAFKGCLLWPSSATLTPDQQSTASQAVLTRATPDTQICVEIPNLTHFFLSSLLLLETRCHRVPTFRLPTPVLMRPSSKELRRCSSWTFLTPRCIRPSATWMSYILGFWNGSPPQQQPHPGKQRIITGLPAEVTRSEENGCNKIIIIPPDVSPLWRPRLTNSPCNDRVNPWRGVVRNDHS